MEERKFKEKLQEFLKNELETIKKSPIQMIGIFLYNTIIVFLTVFIGLYFITRPYECETKQGETLKIEEMKFYYNNITTCKYEIINDFKNIIYAIKNKPIINQTETGGTNEWQIKYNLTN